MPFDLAVPCVAGVDLAIVCLTEVQVSGFLVVSVFEVRICWIMSLTFSTSTSLSYRGQFWSDVSAVGSLSTHNKCSLHILTHTHQAYTYDDNTSFL